MKISSGFWDANTRADNPTPTGPTVGCNARTFAQTCAKGNKQAVQLAIESAGLKINEPLSLGMPPFGWSGIMFACRNLNEDAIRELLKHGANPKILTNGGFTPMMAVAVASSSKSQDRSVSCAKVLVEAGANVADCPWFNGRSLLTRAVLKETKSLVEFLVQAGADANERDGHGETPLNIAVSRNLKDIAQVLIDNGASPYVNNGNGESCLDLTLKCFEEGSDPDSSMGTLVALWRMEYYEKNFNKKKREFRRMLNSVNRIGSKSGKPRNNRKSVPIPNHNTKNVSETILSLKNTRSSSINQERPLNSVGATEPSPKDECREGRSNSPVYSSYPPPRFTEIQPTETVEPTMPDVDLQVICLDECTDSGSSPPPSPSGSDPSNSGEEESTRKDDSYDSRMWLLLGSAAMLAIMLCKTFRSINWFNNSKK